MYDGYENNVTFVFEGELTNGLQVCVWRDIDNALWEVSVANPDDIWNLDYDEKFRDARSVLEYMAVLRKVKRKS